LAQVHWRYDLNVIHRVETKPIRNAIQYEIAKVDLNLRWILKRVDDAPSWISYNRWHQTLRKNRRTVGLEHSSLANNFIQNERWNELVFNAITKDVTSADGRKLVMIADEDQSSFIEIDAT
jgi:hypothetical protein